jgi:hypothetical protein
MSPTVSLKGIKENPTLLASSLTRGTDEGKPVKISANKTAALSSDDQVFCGIIESIELDNSVCVVRNHGMAILPYTGTAPTIGYGKLSANGTGGVRISSGTVPYYFIYDVDTTNELVTFDLG